MSCFTVRYHPLDGGLSVQYNGAEMTQNPMSRFALLRDRDCAAWMPLFSQACTEASGTAKGYSVAFTGEAMYAAVLRRMLQGVHMTEARDPVTFVTTAHRLRWAAELGDAVGRPFRLAPLRIWSNAAGERLPQPEPLSPGWPVPLQAAAGAQEADVLLVRSETEYRELCRRLLPPAGMRLFLMDGSGAWQVTAADRSGCLAACGAANLADGLRRWYEAFLLPGQIIAQAQRVQSAGVPAGPEQTLQHEKLRMLTDGSPWLHLPLPAQIHAGDESHFIRPQKLPEDMKVLVRTDPRYVAVRADKAIIPVAEGRCAFTLTPKDVSGAEQPAFSQRQTVDIVFPHPVTAIRLNASATQLLAGGRFTVTPAYTPVHADNTAQARWHISDPAVAVRQPSGEFVAKAPGRCTITLSVGAVSASVDVEVKAQATGIRVSRRVQEVRLSDGNQHVAASILPAGAGNGQLRFTVDPLGARVLDVDSRTGQITPRDEGTARVTVELTGLQGGRSVTRVCEVRVTPDQPVITPDVTSVLAIVLLLLAGFVLPSTAANALLLASAATAGYGLYTAHTKLTRIINLCLIALAVGLAVTGWM